VIEKALHTLNLPPDAVRWLLDLWHVIQVWDDVADGDPIKREDLDRAIFLTVAPFNPFYEDNKRTLFPVLANMVLKWKASDTIEREGLKSHLHKAYMLRAGYYDVVLQVLAIVKGEDVAMAEAHKVALLYGETFEEYAKEFQDA